MMFLKPMFLKPAKKNPADDGQSGSAIVYILIAVAMFAALSMALMQMSRQESGEAVNTELSRIQASEIMQFAQNVQRGVRGLRINGADEAELCFDSPEWDHNDYDHAGCTVSRYRLFDAEGGGVVFQAPVDDWYTMNQAFTDTMTDEGEWLFSARHEITNVGTDGGTANSEDASVELLMVTAPLHDHICRRINILLGHDPAPPVTDALYDNLAGNKFTGTFSGGSGKFPETGRERCVQDDEGYNVYYKVVLAR